MRIYWNNFLKIAIKEYPKESCGFLFSKMPYSEIEEWHVFPIKNIHARPHRAWIPDKKELAKIKKDALERELVLIGNIHTHPHKPNIDLDIQFLPSETDTSYAKKYNDIIRGIVVTDGKIIYGIQFHDKFENIILSLWRRRNDSLNLDGYHKNICLINVGYTFYS